ncbi:MAG: hypothetical protein JNJ60_12285 [Rhodocyclaceae bacterium]|nr:hypothetical protein [Rhodocyclaceae bacterium]
MIRSFSIALLLCLALPATAARADAPTPIASARGLARGTPALVEGYVSVEPGRYASSTGDQGFAIQDASGGLYVSQAARLKLAAGSRVRVQGRIEDDGHGQIVIVPAGPRAIRQLPGRRLPQPEPRRSGDIGAEAAGLLVRVSGRISAPPQADLPWGYKLHVDDGSGAVLVFIAASTRIDALRAGFIETGGTLRVTGFVSRYEQHYEILPRRRVDLEVLRPAPAE